jgi:hypothetical protein
MVGGVRAMGINGVVARKLVNFDFKEETRWDLVKVRKELSKSREKAQSSCRRTRECDEAEVGDHGHRSLKEMGAEEVDVWI